MVWTGAEGNLAWRKARKCDGGACVEIAMLGETVMVRNSANPGVILSTSSAEWLRFLTRIIDESSR